MIFFSTPPWQQQQAEWEATLTQSQSTHRRKGMQVTSVQVDGVAVVTIVVGGVGVGVMVGVGEGWWMKCQSDVGVGWEYRSASEQERIPTWCKDSRRTSAFRESPPTRKKSSCGPML